MHTTAKKIKGFSLTGVLVTVALIMMLLGTYYYLTNSNKINRPILADTATIETPVIAPPAIEKPVIETPVIVKSDITSPKSISVPTKKNIPPAKPVTVTLPSLNDSDTIASVSAQQLSTQPKYTSLLVNQDMIRSLIVFVDNFSRGELVSNFTPLAKPSKPFSVIERDNHIYLNPESYNRYNVYADIIASIDIASAIRQYNALKPLFKQAYQEIGYADNEFDSHLVQAIELTLDAPVIREPIALVAPSVMYKFADPELEALPATQKLLIRMGPDNTLKLKAKLQQIEDALYDAR